MLFGIGGKAVHGDASKLSLGKSRRLFAEGTMPAGEGAAGSLTRFESYVPSHAGTLVYFSVDDIDKTLRRVNANGGKTLLPEDQD